MICLAASFSLCCYIKWINIFWAIRMENLTALWYNVLYCCNLLSNMHSDTLICIFGYTNLSFVRCIMKTEIIPLPSPSLSLQQVTKHLWKESWNLVWLLDRLLLKAFYCKTHQAFFFPLENNHAQADRLMTVIVTLSGLLCCWTNW